MKEKLFIGVLTYNRVESLKKLVTSLKTFTACPYELVVSCSDSSDGTITWCAENDVRVITSDNKGIAQGKNLLLYYFLHKTECNHVILLEDDCRVWEHGWEQEWRLACTAWEHVNWPICPTNEYEYGGNTPGNPIRTNWFGGVCTITSRSALEAVGYLDPRFIGYGGEHAEWTWRFYRQFREQWGEPCEKGKTVPCLRSHVGVEFEQTLFEKEVYKRNIKLMERLLEEDQSIYREPWLDEAYKAEFLGFIEQAAAQRLSDSSGVAGERCPLCGCRGVLVGMKENVAIRQCCGVMLAWAWESEAAYARLYTDSDVYPCTEQQANQQKPFTEREADHVSAAFQRISLIRSFRPGARTLTDIGCGTGALVHAAAQSGFDAMGFDLNQTVVDFARANGRRVLTGDWSSIKYFSDVIALVDVFEHLTRPKECLAYVKQFLQKDGLLYIEMPEAACRDHHVQKLNWKHIRPRQHVCIYSDTAAQKLFSLCGLKVEFCVRPKMGKLGKIAYGLTVNES